MMQTEVTEEGERRKSEILIVETARLEVRRNFFNIRAAKTWNDIPEEVKSMTSVNAFKNAYDVWREKQNLVSAEAMKRHDGR